MARRGWFLKRTRAPVPKLGRVPSGQPTILFTGFEPSGDDHAAAAIAELLARHPHVRVCAWGGPKMEAAGAEIVEHTGKDAVVGLPGVGKILEHRRINARVAEWVARNKPAVHVPVDSPAANFPICKITKRAGARVVHLVAPQVWAWGSWRIHKLRRLTDFVCCLLPFEEQYFRDRGVEARFVGHPLFDTPLDLDALDSAVAAWPRGETNLAVMPGSRPAELRQNAPLLVEVYRQLEAERPGLRGVVAAATDEIAGDLPALAGGAWPDSLRIERARTDEIVRWCDAALVVSGTVTLQVARQARPMLVVYKWSRLVYWLIGRWLLRTRYFTLPNLIAGREIVPEMVPYFGGPGPVLDRLRALLDDPGALRAQRETLGTLAGIYRGRSAAEGAARAIAWQAGLEDADAIPDVLGDGTPPLEQLARAAGPSCPAPETEQTRGAVASGPAGE